MPDAVRPQDVLADGLKDDLIDAMKYAYMCKGAFDSGELQGLELRPDENKVGGSSWKYRINLGVMANDPEITCDSSGNWRHEQFIGGDDSLGPGSNFIDANDNAYEVILPDAAAKWQDIEEFVDDWVQPWVEGITPNPNEFTNQINSLATVAKQLYVGNAPAQGGGKTSPVSADADLWDALTQLEISADDTSQAVDLFEQNYATDIWKTIGGQNGLVTAAVLAMTAEAAAWHESYKSLRDFLEVARSDFLVYAGSSDGGGDDLAAALGATSTVAGVLGAGVSIALPPFGAALGLIAGAASVAQLMNPAEPSVPDTSLVLGSGDFYSKVETFKGEIKKIEKNLADAELMVSEGCDGILADFQLNPDNYSLRRHRKKQGDYENFPKMYNGRIELTRDKLLKTAAACQLIAEHQRGLASILAGGDAAGYPSSPVPDEFYRNSLPEVGVIGSGSSGPLFTIQKLVDQTVDLLIDESRESHRVAEWLIELVHDFADNEAGIAARNRRLHKLAAGIDDHALSLGNDHDDPSSITS